MVVLGGVDAVAAAHFGFVAVRRRECLVRIATCDNADPGAVR